MKPGRMGSFWRVFSAKVMPRLRSFVEETGPEPYEFEVTGGTWWDGQRQLTCGGELIANLKDMYPNESGLKCASQSQFEFVCLRNLQPIRMITEDGMLYTGWLSFDFVDTRSAATLANVRVADPKTDRVEAGPHLTLRVWRKDSGGAAYLSSGHLVMTSHPAWRDSDVRRKVLEVYRIHGEHDELVKTLAALALMIVWPERSFIRTSE